ncbi:MAG: Cys-Gln thioester bond-forming surface protein [Propionibacteriaceae bacterium]|nr:Cys-Gln thioester bond-forming surface protein [Propionibacteriaceae bacterium]
MFTFQRAKKTLPLLTAIVVVLGVLLSFSAPAMAANDVFRIVLRYYDPIQITYTIQYPAQDDRGQWTGPEDVPIGGAGVPDPANKFGITDYLATQIYCVDPFTPFHNRVAGLGGSFAWDTGAMSDTLSGYVSAAPWVWSGAMQVYGDAVSWIAMNGYHGNYNYKGTDDPESQASVARLNTMFPGIGPTLIDKEIAVMATKVAIWKTIAGSSVEILSTTLDGTAKRTTFDALVTALVNEGATVLDPAGRLPLTGELTSTSMTLQISDIGAIYDDSTSAAYDIYGPLTAEANLENAPVGSTLEDMDRVFLTATGLNTNGVQFITSVAPDPLTALPTDSVPGTTDPAQYVTGTGAGTTWTSDEFYLAIPKTRTDPDRGDALMVNAAAMSPKVTVNEGTPVVFAFANNDVQDWDAIQAFIGATTANQQVNLYARANWFTGDTTLGSLYVTKQVDMGSPMTTDQEFEFAVYLSKDSQDPNPHRLDLSENPVSGAFSVDTTANTFTLKDSGIAFIQGLPMVVSGGNTAYEYYYWVEEVNLSADFDTPHLEVANGSTLASSVDGARIGPFMVNDSPGPSVTLVTATNTRGQSELLITKKLSGKLEAWGVTDTTPYEVRIKDLTNNNYLTFTGSGATYSCTGNTGSSDPDSADLIMITAGQAVRITNLWTNVAYQVEEVKGVQFTTTYQGNPATLTSGTSSTVTITNTYGDKPLIETGGTVAAFVGDPPIGGLPGVAGGISILLGLGLLIAGSRKELAKDLVS